MNRRGFLGRMFVVFWFLSGLHFWDFGKGDAIGKLSLRDMDINYLDPDLLFPGFLYENNFVVAIGKKYLEINPPEADRELLGQSILGVKNGNEYLGRKKLILPSVKQKIKKEFEHRKIIVIEGWVMTITEARICAYYAIGDFAGKRNQPI